MLILATALAVLKITGNIQLSWWWIAGLISVRVIYAIIIANLTD